jgi:3-hydroxyisobutyrate dehydrogenase-like beta-hydroxyacid dehydrogenase
MRSTNVTSSDARPIGLIGLGLIGTALAGRLLAGGRNVLGFDIDERRRNVLVAGGGYVANGPSEVCAASEVVLLSLPTEMEVRSVLEAAGRSLQSGQTVVDTSTCAPEASIAIAHELHQRGIAYLDATISGSSEQVARGEALFMVGGNRETFERCEWLWPLLAREALHVGDSGGGARMKLVTNLVLGLNRAALAEGIALAAALGLDLELTLQVLRASAAYSKMMDTKGEKLIRREFSPAARLAQHLKDVRLMLAAAETAGAALPLTETHRELLEEAVRLGWGDLDNSAVLLAIEAASRANAGDKHG